jgi:ATP-dependent protease ClpP protease subunit
MKQNVFPSEGAKADMTKRDKELDKLFRKMNALKLSKEQRTKILNDIKKMERDKWMEYITRQEQQLKRSILPKKKIIETQTPKINS